MYLLFFFIIIIMCLLVLQFLLYLITLSVHTFGVNIQFGTVVFKKINLVPIYFKMYPNWSFPLSST